VVTVDEDAVVKVAVDKDSIQTPLRRGFFVIEGVTSVVKSTMSKLNACAMSILITTVLSTGVAIHPGKAFGQTVYQVIDEHGNVTFTDNPGRGGKALELTPLPSLPPPLKAAIGTSNTTATPAAIRPRGKPGQPFMPYDHFSIALPQQGARLTEKSTPVEVAIAPPLRDDHQVRLLVNGEISQTALHSDVFWLTGLPAGQHMLQAELLDSSQRLQHRTSAVVITVP